MAHYKDMTLPELEKANQKLMAERTKIGEEQDKIKTEMNKRLSELSTDALIESLSDVQIEAVKAKLGVGG